MTKSTRIHFAADLFEIKDQTILKLPAAESEKLPSRGPVAVVGTMNGCEIKTVLEPDGDRGHFLKVDRDMREAMGAAAGDRATLELQLTKDWPEPVVPEDLARALATAPQKVKDIWTDITPMARWEWVRWVDATANMDTRAVRIEKSISKLNGSHRRPCCFNLTACTDPHLSKNGRLLEPAPHP